MAISFAGKKPNVPVTTVGKAAPGPKPAAAKPGAAPAAKPAAKPGAPALSFIKRGKEAQTIAAQEEAQAEMRSKNKVFRFWLPKDAESKITFLDGDLDADGILDIPFFHEHQVNMNGSWDNHFICTQDEEPCPVCEGGSGPSYVGMLTVIDHSEYTSKKDNKVHKDNVKLFVAKRDTIKLLQKLAAKRSGLRGCTFDVSRTGDKSPSVGSAFDFTEKLPEAKLQALYKDKHQPVDYENYLASIYLPAKELRKLGFGNTAAPVGSEPSTDAYDV